MRLPVSEEGVQLGDADCPKECFSTSSQAPAFFIERTFKLTAMLATTMRTVGVAPRTFLSLNLKTPGVKRGNAVWWYFSLSYSLFTFII